MVNPRDELSLKRIVRLIPGIGAKGADRLWREFKNAHGKLQPGAKPRGHSSRLDPLDAAGKNVHLHAGISVRHVDRGSTGANACGIEHAGGRVPGVLGKYAQTKPSDAVEAYATVGEISDVFRDLWGEYRESN